VDKCCSAPTWAISDRDELGWLASTFGGHALDGLKPQLHVFRLLLHIHPQRPRGSLEILHAERSSGAFSVRKSLLESL
jgi:hypothetical protein